MHSKVMKAILAALDRPKSLQALAAELGRHPSAVHKDLKELEDVRLVVRASVPNPRSGKRGQPKTLVVWAISSIAEINLIARVKKSDMQ